MNYFGCLNSDRHAIGSGPPNGRSMRPITLSLALCAALVSSAQLSGRGSLGGGIGLSIPTGDFRETLDRNLFHVNAHLALPFKRVPILQSGFDFGYSVLGNYQRAVPLNTEYLDITEGLLTTRNKAFSYHGFLRLSPLRGRVRPYVDGLLGLRQFRTTSKVTADGVEGHLSKEANQWDIAFSAGWAAGLMVTFGKIAYVEGRVEHFNSGKATYVDPASVTINDQGTVNFSTLTSNTDVTNVTVGIGLLF